MCVAYTKMYWMQKKKNGVIYSVSPSYCDQVTVFLSFYERLVVKYIWKRMTRTQLCYSKRLTACIHAKQLQLCLTLCNPMDDSPPGSCVQGILQAGILDWVAILSTQGLNPRLLCFLHCQVSSLSLALPGNSRPTVREFNFSYEKSLMCTIFFLKVL